jgi:hypothetical protein
MIVLRCLAAAFALALMPALAAQEAAPAAPAGVNEDAQKARAAMIRERIETRRRDMAEIRERVDARSRNRQLNASGELRVLREPLFDGYVLGFEHSLVFEDVREQAGFKVREYELALRLIEPRVAMAELMERLLDAGFTVEEPTGPPQARVLRFWRQGRSMEDARFSVHVGERALSSKPEPVERGATGVMILRLYERQSEASP